MKKYTYTFITFLVFGLCTSVYAGQSTTYIIHGGIETREGLTWLDSAMVGKTVQIQPSPFVSLETTGGSEGGALGRDGGSNGTGNPNVGGGTSNPNSNTNIPNNIVISDVQPNNNIKSKGLVFDDTRKVVAEDIVQEALEFTPQINVKNPLTERVVSSARVLVLQSPQHYFNTVDPVQKSIVSIAGLKSVVAMLAVPRNVNDVLHSAPPENAYGSLLASLSSPSTSSVGMNMLFIAILLQSVALIRLYVLSRHKTLLFTGENTKKDMRRKILGMPQYEEFYHP